MLLRLSLACTRKRMPRLSGGRSDGGREGVDRMRRRRVAPGLVRRRAVRTGRILRGRPGGPRCTRQLSDSLRSQLCLESS